jgi:uncharacterized protein YggE
MEIKVSGTGHCTRKAERAILVLQAKSDQHPTAAEASATVISTASKIRELITPHCPQDETTGATAADAAISHYSMTTLDTTSHRERKDYDREEYVTTFSARAVFHIKFADFSVLNTLTTQFSGMPNVTIQRIEWHLTDATKASIEERARKHAAQHAIEKARNYAEAFAGVANEDLGRRVKAVEVVDKGYYKTDTRPQLHYGKGLRRGAVERSDELQFQPEDVRMELNVEAKFIVVD